MSLPLSAKTAGPQKSLLRQRHAGFSLIELAVVIVVITLLIGSLLVPLTTQVDTRRHSETEKQLELIKEALMGYALARGHLPCPAVSAADGSEDRTGTACNKRVGFIPWLVLGMRPDDAWDNMIRYSVVMSFTNADPTLHFNLGMTGDIQICAGSPPCAPADPTPGLTNNDIPVILISHGKNGYGATTRAGVARAAPATWSTDEQTNATASQVFVSRPPTDIIGINEFDDIVVWMSLNRLFAKMVSAEQLP